MHIAGHSIRDRMEPRLAAIAFENVTQMRGNIAGCVVNSDRGSQGELPGRRNILIRKYGKLGRQLMRIPRSGRGFGLRCIRSPSVTWRWHSGSRSRSQDCHRDRTHLRPSPPTATPPRPATPIKYAKVLTRQPPWLRYQNCHRLVPQPPKRSEPRDLHELQPTPLAAARPRVLCRLAPARPREAVEQERLAILSYSS